MHAALRRMIGAALPGLLAAVLPAAAAPTLQIIYPRPAAEVEGVVNLRVFAYEGAIQTQTAQVDTVKFFRKADSSNKILLVRIASSGEWSGVWNASALASGPDTLVFRGINSGASTRTDSQFTVTIANNGNLVPPTVEIASPTAGSTVSGTVSIAFTAAAGTGTLSTREISFDGAAYFATSSAAAHTWNTVPLNDGAHTVRLRVTNSNGASAESRLTTYYVANTPTITWLSPAGGSTISGRLILDYDGAAQGSATLASDSLFVDGAPFASLHAPDGPDTVDLSALADGLHTFSLKATDNAGKTGVSASVALLLQNGPFARIDSALADSTVSGRLVVRFRMGATPPSTLAKRQIAFDGGPWRAVSGDSSDTVDTRALSEGSHAVQVRAEDDRGRSAVSRLVEFTVRNAPKVSLLSPAVDAFVRGTVTVRFKAEAVAPDTIASAQISVGGGEWVPAPDDSTYTLNTRLYKDGDLRVQVRAVDGHGKAAVSLIREIVIDNSPPKLSYPQASYPGNAPSARKGMRILATAQGLDFGSGMASDSAMAFSAPGLGDTLVPMRDDGKEGDKVAGDNVYSLSLDVGSGESGDLLFSIRARDALGNDTTVGARLALDNSPPVLSMRFSPAPGNLENALTGSVYSQRVLVTGTFRDVGNAGMASLTLTVRNPDSGHVNNSPDLIPLLDGSFRRVLELVPGANRVDLIGTDRAGNADTVSGTLTYLVPKATALIPPSGGEVRAADGTRVVLPEGALPAAREITITAGAERAEPKPLSPDIRLLGVPHEFGPDGQVFPRPVTIVLPYTAADLDRDQDGKPDFEEDKLTIVFWNGRDWLRAGEARIDKGERTVSVAVNHFTLFDLAEDNSPAPTSVVGFWDRNPVPGQAEFVYRLPGPGTASLSILDMAGDLAKQLIAPGTRVSGSGSVRWDGSNGKGRFSGAGLYVYVFRYQSDDGKTEKLIRKPVGLIGK